jgi:Brp/Blh family beta-carotene 15,15'-monooxygenase
MVRLAFRQWQSVLLVIVASTCLLLSFFHINLGVDNPAVMFIMICSIMVLGVPHGALDYSLAVNGLGLVSMSRKIQFLLFYLAIVLLSIGLWLLSPISGFLLFMFMSVWHFSEDWSFDVGDRRHCAIAVWLITMPALFKPNEFNDILSVLWLTTGQIEIVTIASQFGAIAASAFVLFGYKRENIVLYLELIALLIILTQGGILQYFTAYFCIIHSPLYVRRFVIKVPMKRIEMLFQLMAIMIATVMLLSALWWLSDVYQIDVGIYAWLFIGLFALTVPHMLLVEKCFIKT